MLDKTAMTAHQQMIFDALIQADMPLGAYELLNRLRGKNLKAPLQVYRALEKLIEMGVVHRLESLNAFVACAHTHDGRGGVAFAICDNCGQVEEFAESSIERTLSRWSRQNDFKPNAVTIELHGICGHCEGNAE